MSSENKNTISVERENGEIKTIELSDKQEEILDEIISDSQFDQNTIIRYMVSAAIDVSERREAWHADGLLPRQPSFQDAMNAQIAFYTREPQAFIEKLDAAISEAKQEENASDANGYKEKHDE